MFGWLASTKYSTHLVGISIKASGSPATILHVGSFLTKAIASLGVLGILLNIEKRAIGCSDPEFDLHTVMT